MTWRDLLPEAMASEQEAWEKRQRFRRSRARIKDIAAFYRISYGRVQQQMHRKNDEIPPLSRLFDQPLVEWGEAQYMPVQNKRDAARYLLACLERPPRTP